MLCTENGQQFEVSYAECPEGSQPVSIGHTSALHAAAGTPWWHWALIALGAIMLLGMVLSAATIIEQYERGVVFRFGRVIRTLEPGLRFVIPLIDRVEPVDLQVVTLALEPQQVITKDSVSLGIKTVVYYKVEDPVKSVVEIEVPEEAITQLGQAIMRRVVGGKDLSQVLEHGKEVSDAIQTDLESGAQEWGLKITRIEIKDIDLPEGMRRAMASKAEASREAEAKVIAAKGEEESAEHLKKAASDLDGTALRLRELQTLREIGTDNATVIVAPNGGFGELAGAAAAGSRASSLQ